MSDGYHYPDSPRLDMLDFIPRAAGTVLDVGCGLGGFGAALKHQRPEITVHGVESSKEAAATAARRLDRVEVGLFPDAIPTDQKYDVVTFLDVLEHMENPAAALTSTKDLLAEGGVVVASLPNVRHHSVTVPLVVYGRWDYKDVGVLDRTHLRFFTKDTMSDLFDGLGYRVEKVAPLWVVPPARFSTTWFALGLVGRARREQMTPMQYAIVARPRTGG